MEVDFLNGDYRRLETDGAHATAFPQSVVSAYRRQLQVLRAAVNDHDLYALKSLKFTKLNGKRTGQHSIWLTDHSCLIVELVSGKSTESNKSMRVICIEEHNYQEK